MPFLTKASFRSEEIPAGSAAGFESSASGFFGDFAGDFFAGGGSLASFSVELPSSVKSTQSTDSSALPDSTCWLAFASLSGESWLDSLAVISCGTSALSLLATFARVCLTDGDMSTVSSSSPSSSDSTCLFSFSETSSTSDSSLLVVSSRGGALAAFLVFRLLILLARQVNV